MQSGRQNDVARTIRAHYVMQCRPEHLITLTSGSVTVSNTTQSGVLSGLIFSLKAKNLVFGSLQEK